MEGVSIIEDETLKHWEKRLISIEQNQLALMKAIQGFMPPLSNSNLKDFIAIVDACKKYKVSKVTINNKIKLFKIKTKREIDRIQSGTFKLINEIELQEALRIKGTYKLD